MPFPIVPKFLVTIDWTAHPEAARTNDEYMNARPSPTKCRPTTNVWRQFSGTDFTATRRANHQDVARPQSDETIKTGTIPWRPNMVNNPKLTIVARTAPAIDSRAKSPIRRTPRISAAWPADNWPTKTVTPKTES